ncbi:MAG TPA: hypothetical protein VFY79_11655 [Dehalococcoidia bacterium]|nr:hypothetical protein [Dehalococcoidia bacterium]
MRVGKVDINANALVVHGAARDGCVLSSDLHRLLLRANQALGKAAPNGTSPGSPAEDANVEVVAGSRDVRVITHYHAAAIDFVTKIDNGRPTEGYAALLERPPQPIRRPALLGGMRYRRLVVVEFVVRAWKRHCAGHEREACDRH